MFVHYFDQLVNVGQFWLNSSGGMILNQNKTKKTKVSRHIFMVE